MTMKRNSAHEIIQCVTSILCSVSRELHVHVCNLQYYRNLADKRFHTVIAVYMYMHVLVLLVRSPVRNGMYMYTCMYMYM